MSNQKNVTLSPRALAEFEEVALWLGMPSASLMRQVLETYHQSPDFDTLLKRARSEAIAVRKKGDDSQQVDLANTRSAD